MIFYCNSKTIKLIIIKSNERRGASEIVGPYEVASYVLPFSWRCTNAYINNYISTLSGISEYRKKLLFLKILFWFYSGNNIILRIQVNTHLSFYHSSSQLVLIAKQCFGNIEKLMIIILCYINFAIEIKSMVLSISQFLFLIPLILI